MIPDVVDLTKTLINFPSSIPSRKKGRALQHTRSQSREVEKAPKSSGRAYRRLLDRLPIKRRACKEGENRLLRISSGLRRLYNGRVGGTSRANPLNGPAPLSGSNIKPAVCFP